MPISLNDAVNPAESNQKLNLIQTLNTFAFVLKRITGQESWRIPPPLALTELETMGTSIKFTKCINDKLILVSNNAAKVIETNVNRV